MLENIHRCVLQFFFSLVLLKSFKNLVLIACKIITELLCMNDAQNFVN